MRFSTSLRGRDIDPVLFRSKGRLPPGDAGENRDGEEGANIEADICTGGVIANDVDIASEELLGLGITTAILSWSCKAIN
jgi:hypothetical protein